MSFAKPGTLQRHTAEKTKPTSPASAGSRHNEAPQIVHDVLRSSGQPLDAGARDVMESRFGHDFSRVRVHTDTQADRSARAVSAEAFTVSDHIVFRSGNYAPASTAGKKLLAHELTHTLQQQGTAQTTGSNLTIADVGNALEKQAEQSESIVAATPEKSSPRQPLSQAKPAIPAAPSIQRQPTPAATEDPKRYQQTHDALFTPPTKAGASSGSGAAIPVFDATAQDTTKKQFEQWITKLKEDSPLLFAHEMDDNTGKKDADKSMSSMNKQLLAHFPQIPAPIPDKDLVWHVSILKEAEVAKDDFLKQWLSNRLLSTDIANYQLKESDPTYQKFLDDILADKKIGPLVRELARHGAAYIEESGGNREVHLNPAITSDLSDVTLLHELVHFYAHPAYKAWIDTTSNPRFFGEGFTEVLARKAMTPAQLKSNGSAYQKRVDLIDKEITPKIPEDDLARAYFAGEVWRIEFKSGAAQKAFKDQIKLDPTAKSPTEKKESQTSVGIVQEVTPGAYFRFMNLGEETAGPKPEHKTFFATIVSNFVAKDSTARLRFVGHASSAGSKSAADKLSLAQATAFYKMAHDAGVSDAQLVDAKAPPHSGQTQPTAGNDDVIGRSFNRRVELFITHVGASTTPTPPPSPSSEKDSVQRKPDGSSSAVQPITLETARLGVRDASGPLPYASEIQRSFGRHFIGDIKTQVGGPAAAAGRAIGATAYATGGAVGFAQSPDLATAAHEAAHIVQQRRGVELPGGVGSVGDAYEKQADAAASLVQKGASAEAVLDRSSGSGGPNNSVQRLAFVNESQVKKGEKDFTSAMKSMVADTPVRNYLSLDEFKKHAEKTTDYLGNLKDGTWLRFSPTGTNLLGENHTQVTLEDSVTAVGSKSFIYEPFSSDKMAAGSNFETAYTAETTDRFKLLGVEKEKDKQKFGAESLLPKMGFNLTLLQPYFDGTSNLDDLKSGLYIGQPTQRYLKIAWGWSKDNQLDVARKAKARDFVPPKLKKLADVHLAVTGKLDPFITTLKVDGYLGDELAKKANLPLLPLLADFSRAFTEAMMRVAADSPSSRLSNGARLALTGSSPTDEKDKMKMFSEWRDFMFEDNVAAATKRGVRYAGMGQAHLDHLVKTGLDKAQHPFEMEGKDIADFKALTEKLKKVAGVKP